MQRIEWLGWGGCVVLAELPGAEERREEPRSAPGVIISPLPTALQVVRVRVAVPLAESRG